MLLAVAAATAEGGRLPIKLYTMADGLPSSELACAVRDSKGFLWFCTSEGLSSFDGYRFTNYGVDQGLPDARVIGLVETRDGEYWVATVSAISRFLPDSSLETDRGGDRTRRFFEPYRFEQDGQVRARVGVHLAEAPDGRLWLLTTSGLLRFDRTSRQFEQIDMGRRPAYSTFFHDRDDSLWLGTEHGLFRRLPDGRVESYGTAEGLPVWSGAPRISAVFRDRDHRLWVGTWKGLCLMSDGPAPGRISVDRIYTQRDGLADDVVMALFQSHDGVIWIATETGLSLLGAPGTSPDRFRTYPGRGGLNPWQQPFGINSFVEDRRNDIWMAGVGAMRLARDGLTTYAMEDGLATNAVASVLEDRDGRLIVVTGGEFRAVFNVFDGERFRPVVPRLPEGITSFTWGHGQTHFQDHQGDWWIATCQGLCRYAGVRRVEDLAHARPDRVFTTRDGLPGDSIYALYEDSRRDIWISVVGPDVVTLWSRADGSIRSFRQGEDGRPLGTPTAFAEDRAGNVWMSFYWRNLARYRDGKFEVFTAGEGLPEGAVTGLLVDHAGRLWVGTSRGGLARLDDPSAARPRFSVYTTRSGLASNAITSLAEDVWGRVYAGTGRGIDRLDPDTGQVRHFGNADGIAFGSVPAVAYRDRQGALWFGSMRLWPAREEAAAQLPPIRITRIQVRGVDRPISTLGETRISGLRLGPSENQVQIEFASLKFGRDQTIRYQCRLEGTEHGWGPALDSRSVNYAVLSPGSYRFMVRAVNAEGLASPVPASVEFTVLRPFWQRWWFWAAGAVALALAAVSAHRYRLRQVLELERVRTRIATDLHDDIGSSLTQIAVLSEVVKRNVNGNGDSAAHLSRMADLSRELVGSMSDIVWSINPKRDHLSDLTYRMRRFASDVFTARDIDFDFTAPEDGEDAAVRAEVRRQTFLVFKECVHNAVKHAGCNRVEVSVAIDQRQLSLRVTDNGNGFANPGNGHGHGLASMEQRARGMGGRLRVSSEPGRGTVVALTVPLDPGRAPAGETTT